MTTPRCVLGLCLAGLGSRFTNAGYTTPKFLLPMRDGKTPILREIILSFSGIENALLVMVFNNRLEDWKPQIEAAIEHLPCPTLVSFISDTKGQAETAFVITETVRTQAPDAITLPILFHNGDTVLYGRDLNDCATQLAKHAGLIDSFAMNSPAYSYVKTDANNIVTEMYEKVVISDRATTGLYGFKDLETYNTSYQKAAEDWQKEFYISDVYRAMLEAQAPILNIHHADADKTLNLGTPTEYEAYLNAKAA